MENINLIIVLSLVLMIILLVKIYIYFYKKKEKTALISTIESYITIPITSRLTSIRNLPLKDRIELSWKFLYEITELIINNFFTEDKELINKLGYLYYRLV